MLAEGSSSSSSPRQSGKMALIVIIALADRCYARSKRYEPVSIGDHAGRPAHTATTPAAAAAAAVPVPGAKALPLQSLPMVDGYDDRDGEAGSR